MIKLKPYCVSLVFEIRAADKGKRTITVWSFWSWFLKNIYIHFYRWSTVPSFRTYNFTQHAILPFLSQLWKNPYVEPLYDLKVGAWCAALWHRKLPFFNFEGSVFCDPPCTLLLDIALFYAEMWWPCVLWNLCLLKVNYWHIFIRHLFKKTKLG